MSRDEIDLSESQAEVVARAMLAVARVDGAVDPRELALIEGLDSTAATAGPVDPGEAAAALGSEAAREACLFSMLLVALADRTYSPAERELIGRFSEGFGFDSERLEGIASRAKAYLLEPLIGLPSTDVVTEISRKLPL